MDNNAITSLIDMVSNPSHHLDMVSNPSRHLDINSNAYIVMVLFSYSVVIVNDCMLY